MLARLILGADAKFNVSGERAVILAGLGTSIYAAVGWVTMLNGGRFLEYDFMPVQMEPVHEMHALAIFIIEIGVTICVMMTIINLMDSIMGRADDDGSNK